MDDCQRAVPVRRGGAVTVEAWGLGRIAANSSAFIELLEFYGDVLSGRSHVEDMTQLPEQSAQLLERIIVGSLVEPGDQSRITAADLGPLLEAIFELNDLDGLLKNLLGLRTRMLETAQPKPPAPSS